MYDKRCWYSKRCHQNFLLCNNSEITARIADLFSSFCEEVYVVAFFVVMQQQTIGEVPNSVMCLWADNFCLQLFNCNYLSDVPKKPQRPVPKKKPKLIMQDGKVTPVTEQ